MATEFKLPELGENILSGDVVSVLVSEGDTINKDDPVIELETDKATIEVPSSVSGTITAIHVKPGDTVEVGQVILVTEDGAAENGQPKPVQEAEQPAEAEPAVAQESPKEPAPAEPEPPAAEPEAETAPATVEFKLPDLGENIESGTVVGVLVSEGDSIAKDQGVLELETDKATVEVPSPVGGTVKQVHVAEGETASVGQVILTLETAATTPSKPKPKPETKQAEPEPASKEESPAKAAKPAPAETRPVTPPAEIQPRLERGVIPAAPNVRRLAREIGVDIAQVAGTGPAGRISIDDIKRHARERGAAGGAPAGRVAAPPLPDFSLWGQVERQKMSNIRRATARHMDAAWSAIPHVTQFDRADITDLEQLRKRFGKKVEEAGGKLTITAILLKVAAAALKEFPKFNASIDTAKEEIIYKQYYHIGVAVDTERGLLVPVIRNVDQKNIIELAVELGEVAEKARNSKLTLDDIQGGCFTITNLGGIGGANFTPIVNLPEVAILGVSRGSKEPKFKDDGSIEPRLMLPLSLSYDHRLIDGADAARFLRWVVEYLEQPFLTALQGW